MEYHSRVSDQPEYAAASADELERLKELDAENARLKRMYADPALETVSEGPGP
jgi:hypothetical protein